MLAKNKNLKMLDKLKNGKRLANSNKRQAKSSQMLGKINQKKVTGYICI